MTYLDESLAPGETIVARFELHWTAKGRLILGIVLIPVVIGIFITIYEWLRLRAIELGVTSQRVVRKTGIISRNTEELRLTAIETVDLQQTAWGRLLGYGDVRVTGRGESSMLFYRVADPVGVKRAIETAYATNVEHGKLAQRTPPDQQ
ncbi:MAG TPA: PH domain-containing protein [Rudaea sp.]|nr:PH domain-containing protein [Rudaea sp.]